MRVALFLMDHDADRPSRTIPATHAGKGIETGYAERLETCEAETCEAYGLSDIASTIARSSSNPRADSPRITPTRSSGERFWLSLRLPWIEEISSVNARMCGSSSSTRPSGADASDQGDPASWTATSSARWASTAPRSSNGRGRPRAWTARKLYVGSPPSGYQRGET